MEKTITIGNKDVKVRSSGAIPHIYRRMFGQDLFLGMDALAKRLNGKTGNVEMTSEDIELLERLAYCFAKHADPAVPDDLEEWLAGFEIMDVYQVFPEVMLLWSEENVSTSKLKKKADQ